MRFIGIDIGTTSISGVMLDIDKGASETVIRQNNSILRTKYDWETLQDPEIIFGIAREIIDQLISKTPEIAGIGITGQMHGILYVDRDGNPLSPLFNWQDGRGNLLYKNNQNYAEFLTRETGYSVASGYGLVTHFYNACNNLVPANAAKLCTIMDFVVMKLTGRKNPLIDPSNAAGLGFFDLKKLRFNEEILRNISLDPQMLPEVAPYDELAGYYKKTIPVYVGIGDNQSSFLGAARDIRDLILVNVGTSAQLSIYSPKFVRIDTFETRPFPDGGYLLTGAALCGGKSLAILKTFFEDTVKLFCSPNETIDFYKIISTMEEDAVFIGDLPKVATFFNGKRTDSQARGMISNISLTNFTPKNLIIGFIKGIVDEINDFYQQIPANLKRKKYLIGSGNTIRCNKLLRRSLEGQFQRRLHIPKHKEEAAFGACLLAVAAGKYIDNLLCAGQMIEYDTEIYDYHGKIFNN
jgi:sedoheptulokinase